MAPASAPSTTRATRNSMERGAPKGPPSRLSVCAVVADERVGRAVVRQLGIAGGGQLGDDAVGQGLAELDAPLIERVDPPDRALREDLVLVERDQRAERGRREAIGQDRVGRLV